MILKVIDGTFNSVKNVILTISVFLGMYGTYDMLFNMDIPFLFSSFVISVIFLSAWFATAPKIKIQARPITIIKSTNANPVLGGE